MLATTLSACTPSDTRDLAIESARASWSAAFDSINALSSMPASGLRDYVVEAGGLGVSDSLIDKDEAGVRAFAYQLVSERSFILEASESGNVGTALLYISGYYETGGGLSYKKEAVFTCAAVQIDLERHQVLDYEGSECTAPVYAVVGPAGEIDFDEIASGAEN